jgi:hypothetical protein
MIGVMIVVCICGLHDLSCLYWKLVKKLNNGRNKYEYSSLFFLVLFTTIIARYFPTIFWYQVTFPTFLYCRYSKEEEISLQDFQQRNFTFLIKWVIHWLGIPVNDISSTLLRKKSVLWLDWHINCITHACSMMRDSV